MATAPAGAGYLCKGKYAVARADRLLPAFGEEPVCCRATTVRTGRTLVEGLLAMIGVVQVPSFSRRLSSRVKTPPDVWAYWRCNARDDLSRVYDLSLQGLFIETTNPRPVGVTVKIDFLVQEGQIRAEAIVRHVQPGKGLGLKLTAVAESDRPRLAQLMTRLRRPPQFRNTRYRGERPST